MSEKIEGKTRIRVNGQLLVESAEVFIEEHERSDIKALKSMQAVNGQIHMVVDLDFASWKFKRWLSDVGYKFSTGE